MVMHQFVTYDSDTGEITGSFSASSNELVPMPLSPKEAHVEVTDAEQVATLARVEPRRTRLEGRVRGGKVVTLNVRSLVVGAVTLSTDAKDHDGDGVPELPADGQSTARITAKLTELTGGRPPSRSVQITFRTSRGMLSQRRVQAREGMAEIELRSVAETTAARITATADGYEAGDLTIEFIPEQEFRSFRPSGGSEGARPRRGR